MAQGRFNVGSRARAEPQMHGQVKNTLAPSVFQAPSNKPNPPEASESLGGRLP